MKVDFTYANGRQRAMSVRDASILQRMGRGTYLTRDMQAQPPVVPTTAPAAASTAAEESGDDALKGLRAEYQRVTGKRAFHGWGADALREKIAEAAR